MPEVLTRRGSVATQSDALTFEASLSSEQPVKRWFGSEVLVHTSAAIDLSRAKDGLPLLMNHDQNQLVGRVDNVRLVDRKLRGTLRFFDTQAGQDARRLLEGGHRELSVGYHAHETSNRGAGPSDEVRVTRWELLEASIAAMPADPTIGVKRSVQPFISRNTMDHTEDTHTARGEGTALSRSQRRAVQRTQDDEILRRDEIMGMGSIAMRDPSTGIDLESVRRAIEDGTPAEQFRRQVISSMRSRPTDTRGVIPSSDRGMPFGTQYSLQRAVASLVDPHRFRGVAEAEIEASNRMRARSQLQHEGLGLPFDALFPGMTRALSVGVPTAGGNLVGTITDQGPPIDVFRQSVVVAKLGARVLTGLVGNMQFPRKTATSTPGWATETGDAAETGPTVDQISMTPKRLTAYVDFSKQLLIQTGGGAEQMLLDDLRAAVAVLLDTVSLRGTGTSNQPRGIANTSGIGAVVGGPNGAQVTWGHIIGLESAVASADAVQTKVGYVVNTKTRGWLKQQPKVPNQLPIWPDAPIEPEGLERLNGYRAGVTNNMRSNLTKGTASGICSEIIFGSFDDLIIGIWGDGLDITIDPYTLAKSGQVRITIHLWADVAVRRAASFAMMAEALTA